MIYGQGQQRVFHFKRLFFSFHELGDWDIFYNKGLIPRRIPKMNQIKKIVTTTFRKTQKTGQNLTISEFFDFFYFFPRYLRKLFTVCKERCAEYVYQV